MERIRRRVLDEHPNVRIPYFTAHHSPHADQEGTTRPGFERTIQYYGEDGRESFKEVKHKYGVFPTNVRFKKPNEFKFRITNQGTFTINKGGISEPLELITSSIDYLREARGAIRKSSYTEVANEFDPDRSLPKSEPWGIELKSGLGERDVRNLHDNLDSRDWDFQPARIKKSFDDPLGFRAEIVDERSYGRASLRTKGDLIRVYPREHTTFSHFMRIFSFVSDHIDQNSVPKAL
jgi:hypothetical protein